MILGFGGHARSVADVALSAGITSLLFVDENAKPGEHFVGHPVHATFETSIPEGWACMPAAGSNQRRKEQVAFLQAAGLPIATLVSPYATIGVGAEVAAGCFVGHHAHIGPMARVGLAGIVNTGAVIEHDCVVGDFVHVSVNATTAGRSKLGNFVFLGAGATVIDGIEVSDNVVIGAGSVVISSIHCPGTYVGVPVKQVQPLSEQVG